MKVEWLKVAVVVIAREHNPTVLHPSFLRSEGIVPPDWETLEDPVCTPAFAAVSYKNQIRFAVEGSRLQISDTRPGEDLANSMVADLAVKYLKKLPYVRYVEAEIRLQGFVEHDNPGDLLIRRFLQSGPWNENPLLLDSLGIRFEYSVDQSTLDLFLDSGSLEREGEERTGLIANGIYSRELSDTQPVQSAVECLRQWADRCSHFFASTKTILGIGD